MSDELVGNKLGGYTIISLLGEGGMARVYKAFQHTLGREVALKVIRRLPGEDSVERFQREKSALIQLEHPHILPIYDYAGNTEYLWIAMRLVDGGTLEDLLKNGPLPLTKAWEVARQIGSALHFAHENHVIHRDLKPSNVLAFAQDYFYLSDFGVAKLMQMERLTTTGSTLGTPAYMSPEQVRDMPVDARCDQYSLGILCYQMLAGRVPFEGQMVTVLHGHATQPPPPPRQFNADIPSALEEVVLKALAKNPDDRFPTVAHFLDRFGQCVPLPATAADLTAPIPVTTMPPRPWKPPYKKIAAVVLTAGLAMGALAKFGDRTIELKRSIAYCTRTNGAYELEVRDPQGSIRSMGGGSRPRFWPSGRYLCVDSSQETLDNIDVVRVDLKTGERQNLTQHDATDMGGTVSPDEKELVFCSNRQREYKLFKLDLGTKKTTQLTQGSGNDKWPCFSPDGKRLAFCSDRDGRTAIWLSDADGQNARRISNPEEGESDLNPAWSPDGKELVYEHQDGSNTKLRIVNLDEPEEPRTLEHTGITQPRDPSWSPSNFLLFASRQGIFCMRRDGMHLTKVVPAPRETVDVQSPDWGPEEKQGP